MSSGGWGPSSSGRGAPRGGRWDDPEDVPARSSGRRGPPSGRDPREPRDSREGRDPRDGRSSRDPGRGMGGGRGGDRPSPRRDGGGEDWGGGSRSRRDVDLDDRRPSARSGGRSGGSSGGSSGGGRSRDDWGESPRGGRGGGGGGGGGGARDPERARSGSRGAPREDAWAPANARGGVWNDEPAGRSRRGADASGSRSRRPVPQGRGGGLWGDADDAGAGFGRPLTADPRAARRGGRNAGTSAARGRTGRGTGWDAYEDDDEPTSRGKAIGIALGTIVLALVLGAGSAFGYFELSAPKTTTATTPSTTPAVSSPATTTGTPGATPTGTPHAGVAADMRVVWLAGDGTWL